MEIKVFGPGCARCSQTAQVVMDVLAAKGVVASVTLPTMSRCAHRKAMSSTPDIAWKKSSRDSDLVCGVIPVLYKA